LKGGGKMKVGDLVYVTRGRSRTLGIIIKKLSEPRDTHYFVMEINGFQCWCHYLMLERIRNESG